MITCVINIQECGNGISIDQVPLNMKEGTELERQMAGVLDIAMRRAFEFVMECCKSGTMIEGKSIEECISREMKKIGAVNIREQIVKAGYKFNN